jgi:hypothetical protein
MTGRVNDSVRDHESVRMSGSAYPSERMPVYPCARGIERTR